MFIYVECVHLRSAFCSVNREFVYAGKTSREWRLTQSVNLMKAEVQKLQGNEYIVFCLKAMKTF